MNKMEIVKQIIRRVESSKVLDYHIWTIGMTDSPDKRLEQLAAEGNNLEKWGQWPADSLHDAEAIRHYFVDYLGMKDADFRSSGSSNGVFVFIF
ncbi:MAG TPA: hypothetical protein PKJ37_03535 [Acidobacteriota bacterium]|nr:hypothetical protein [Acidobacteriota bacterium]HNT16955.1 hypothetical protein [Acidobacteriota bacterium]